jgi:hypothetical protein
MEKPNERRAERIHKEEDIQYEKVNMENIGRWRTEGTKLVKLG